MEQKDYKEIAKIIKSSFVGHGLTIPIDVRESLTSGLTDYFEENNVISNEFKMYVSTEDKDYFNKQQFLNDCGVEE